MAGPKNGKRGKPPYDGSHKKFNNGHPVRGFYNYIVGQLCANPNMIWVDPDTEDYDEEAMLKQIDHITRTAELICDGIHKRNKDRYNNSEE
jgi:hypothetical protein